MNVCISSAICCLDKTGKDAWKVSICVQQYSVETNECESYARLVYILMKQLSQMGVSQRACSWMFEWVHTRAVLGNACPIWLTHGEGKFDKWGMELKWCFTCVYYEDVKLLASYSLRWCGQNLIVLGSTSNPTVPSLFLYPSSLTVSILIALMITPLCIVCKNYQCYIECGEVWCLLV